MTQRSRVLEMLQAAGALGVPTGDFLSARIPRFSARVLELRRDGYEITRPVRLRSGAYLYKLISEPSGGEVVRSTGPSADGPRQASSAPMTPDTPVEAVESRGTLFELEPEGPTSAITGKRAA